MEDRPLEESEEVIGDQIAAQFYGNASGSIHVKVQGVINPLPKDQGALILQATLNRLSSEQADRQEYLATQFALVNLPKEEQEIKLWAMANEQNSSTQLADVNQQLAYYYIVGQNLLRYELEEWQNESSPLIKLLLQQPRQLITDLATSLQGFTEQFYTRGNFDRLELISLPKSVSDKLVTAGIAVELNRYPTIIQKAAFAVYLLEVCRLISALPEGTTEEGAISAVSAMTATFRPSLQPVA